MRGKFTRTASLSLSLTHSLLLLSSRPPRIPRWTRADSEHDDRRPRYLIRLLMRTIYVQCPCLMIQELLWPAVWSEILDLDYLGLGGGSTNLFSSYGLWFGRSLPFVPSGTHLWRGLDRDRRICCYDWSWIICTGCEMIIRARFYGSILSREKYMTRICYYGMVNLFFLLTLL